MRKGKGGREKEGGEEGGVRMEEERDYKLEGVTMLREKT